MKDLVKESIRTSLQYELKSGHAEKVYQECRERFNTFHLLNYCMYAEAQKGFDLLDEKNKLQFKPKQCYKRTEQVWGKYHQTLRKMLTRDAYGLIADYSIQAHVGIERELMFLKVAIHNTLLKKKMPNAEECSYFLVALCLWEIISNLWHTYFKDFQAKCGLDFSKFFQYANLEDAAFAIKSACESLLVMREPFSVVDEPQFQAAYNALGNKLANDNFYNDAAKRAINLSEVYVKQYAKDIEKAENEGKDEMIDLLSSKFKVSKL